MKDDTSWGKVANWYDSHLGDDDTYHNKIIFPSLIRLLGDIKNKKILDLACGQGMFSSILQNSGAVVTGVDLGKELIDIAKTKNKKVDYFVGASDDLFMIKDKSQDAVICILALQNIEKINETFKEVKRVLKDGGRFIFVINHPSFRIPKQSSWANDNDIQYRRIDEYISESKIKIDMTPGSKTNKKFTVSFHRPMQFYFKFLNKNGFAVSRLEEWTSHKESEKGPRKKAEDKARKEIPMFMMIEAITL